MRHGLILLIAFIFALIPSSFTPAEATAPDSQGRGETLEARQDAAPTPKVLSIIVDVETHPGAETDWQGMAGNLIFLQEGKPFSQKKLDESLEALKICRRFQRVDAETVVTDGKISLRFSLTPFNLIEDIRFKGKYPLFEREVLNVMTVSPGDPFEPKKLEEQKKLLGDLYKREGFIDPGVEVKAEQDPKDGDYVVRVIIQKGPYFSLKRLVFNGKSRFSDKRLELKMKIWRASILPGMAGRFSKNKLKKDVRKLNRFYWKKGFPDAVVQDRVEENPKTGDVEVFIDIEEGPRYKIELDGYKRFWGFTLKKDLVLKKEGNKGNLGVRKSMRKIKERYREIGCLETKVKVKKEDTTEDGRPMRQLRFVILEGPASIVRSLRIQGNESIQEEQVRKQLFTRLPGFLKRGAFVPETLEEDLLAVKALYEKNGFNKAEIEEDVSFSLDKTRVSVDLDITEGPRTMISSLEVTGAAFLSSEEVGRTVRLKQGEPFRNYMLKSDENALSSLCSDKGYPHVKVKGEVNLSGDQTEAKVVYNIDPGPYVEMGDVYYAGNFRTREKIIQRELEIRPGESFSLRRMLEGQRNVREMDIFDSVKFKTIGLKENEEKVDLFVEVEEKKPYYFQIGGGYETQKGFFGKSKVGDHNLFGTNKDAWIGGEVSEIGYRGDLGILEPRLFGTRISATLGLYGERKAEFNQDFGTRVLGASLGFSRKWLRRITTGLNFRYEWRENFLQDSAAPDALSDEELDPRNVLVTTPLIRYDGRDSFIRPRKGVYSIFSVDISKGLENSQDDFLKYKLDVRFYLTVFERLTFAWLARGGTVDPYNRSGFVPEDQLFFLGGTLDVRGFKENRLYFDADGNSVGGTSSVLGSMEARVDLGHNFEFVAFVDAGKLFDLSRPVLDDKVRTSAGPGLRYITPIGPIGVMYGFKLDRVGDEKLGRFHFTIGYTF